MADPSVVFTDNDPTVRTRRLVAVEKKIKRVRLWVGLAVAALSAVATAGFSTAWRLAHLASTAQVEQLRDEIGELRRLLAIYGEGQRRADRAVDRVADELSAMRRELGAIAASSSSSRRPR